jgi:hypothetical protein
MRRVVDRAFGSKGSGFAWSIWSICLKAFQASWYFLIMAQP